jgi:S1-C subfamily serine protease
MIQSGMVSSTKKLVVALIVSLLGAACSGSSSHSSQGTTTTTSTTATNPSVPGSADAVQSQFVSVVDKVRPSIVLISTSSGLGSGVIYDTKGDIVTNAHVVGDAQQFSVGFVDGKTMKASLVGTYPQNDLAVIKVASAPNVKPATFGDSSKLQVGQFVLAVGNPLGLASSVTEGIVSFNGRTVSEGNGVVLPDTVQTSAAINPGNSGGGLVDLNAEVIGIPTLAATDQQLGGGAAPGIGFAIPSNTAKLIADQLISQGKVTNSGRAALGIQAAQVSDSSGQPAGVGVAAVTPGGPADKAGLTQGDVITAVNGQPTLSPAQLQQVLAGLKPGDTATVNVVHPDGSQATVKVTLGSL